MKACQRRWIIQARTKASAITSNCQAPEGVSRVCNRSWNAVARESKPFMTVLLYWPDLPKEGLII